ncbi:uncharacterized protein C8Q71DRAFT_299254 [Rhodofomes roseus]|uniref:Fungal N-terminal domain-containing protein n=1 Tax=Rhodofomes roseus TaxID=34475 RepID=A0ABQ8K3F5_9APHY|nr:uncharacterized protein C8Q71DRAFT_299254 [Rhodofomes roseus]KAH9831347.1 hypothetical protein C8Q71DRAFT_299254 [Rhodofomes roseus]
MPSLQTTVDALCEIIDEVQEQQGASWSQSAMIPSLTQVASAIIDIVAQMKTRDRKLKVLHRSDEFAQAIRLIAEVVKQGFSRDMSQETNREWVTMLAELLSSLNGIRDTAITSRSMTSKTVTSLINPRLWGRKTTTSTSSSLGERVVEMNNMIQIFQMKLAIRARLDVALQKQDIGASVTTPHERGVRVFQLTDIKLLRVCGSWPDEQWSLGEEFEGEWNGRVVIVRKLRTRSTHNTGHTALIHTLTTLYYPYLLQMLGYSHASSPVKFYVLSTAGASMAAYFRDKDLRMKLKLLVEAVCIMFVGLCLL